MTKTRFYNSVNLPERSRRLYERAFFLRNLFQRPDLFEVELKKEETKLISMLPVLENQEQAIECHEAEELSLGDLKRMYNEDIRPIVLKGYAKDNDCVRLWSPAFFKENYGAFKIFFTSTDKIINDEGTDLCDFIDQVLSGNKNRAYIENMSDIFNEYPELHNHLGLDKVANYMEGYASYHRIAQLFFGGLGTGAVFHCANELNCFLNIYGRKKWTFVHPSYSIAMDTTLMNKGYFVGSFVKHRSPKGYIEAHTPLYNRVPKLSIVLEPGDMLLNPPWWWHAIDNLTPATIAVATRWQIENEYIRQNPNYDLVQSMRAERLSSFGHAVPEKGVVISDKDLRKNYVSYEKMGWKDK